MIMTGVPYQHMKNSEEVLLLRPHVSGDIKGLN